MRISIDVAKPALAEAALAEALRARIGDPRYDLWFSGKTTLTWTDDRLVVGVPNHMYLEYVKKTYHEALRLTAQEVCGRAVAVAFVLDPELFRQARQRQQGSGGSVVSVGAVAVGTAASRAEPTPPAPDHEPRKPRPSDSQQRPRRWKRLEDFVVGSCNRVAHAAALHLVEQPGQGPNPLVLHGPVGVGKTHLLQGIRAGWQQRQPDLRVLYLTAEEFTNRFLGAMHERKLSSFRKWVRECDALLLDNLSFLAGKKATMEEFLHTFDALHAADCPLAITCDCHPRLADDLSPELADRLLGGAVWGLTPPEADTRRQLLRSKCVPLGAPLPPEAVDYLAEQLRGNVRELEGALHAVYHLGRLLNRAIDLPLAKEAAADVLRHSVRVLQLGDVERAVCSALGLADDALRGTGRGWAVSHPRMLAIYLARKHTAATYTEIGHRFGQRNHSTAVAGEKKVRGWLAEDASLSLGQRKVAVREVLERIERELQR